ncbi:MAG: cytochrome c biogenesis protein CcdA [Bdellovibrio sp.]|nr:MAG: cytochrome c biogenesis protein CcdA [Bdellovibrio sp.]
MLAILAFAAGLLSFLSPCTLPVLSAYFASGISSRKGEVIKNTVFFLLGVSTVFSLFGMGATMIGSIFKKNRIILTQTAGVLIIIFGILGILGKGFSGLQIKLRKNKKTPLGHCLFGALFAVGWSACIGPILASLLLLSATTGTLLKGTALLFVYSLGLGLPLIIISAYFDRIKNKKLWKILHGKEISFKAFGRKISVHSANIISGIILIIIGILIFNDYLYKLNQIALQSTYVQETIIKLEEYLKGVLLR